MRVHKFAQGTAELTYSQPLASFGGNATLLTQGGHIVISLVPTAIEQDFGLSFTKQGKNQSISFQCAYMLNRNNIAVPPSFGVFASIRKII